MERPLTRGVRATYLVFGGLGFVVASWASRIPQVKAQLHLSAAVLGLVLLAAALGSVLALPFSGAVVHRFGARAAVRTASAAGGVSLAAAGACVRAGTIPVVVCLFCFGAVGANWDVGSNVHAATVERQLGRPIMSRFHAGYSVGTVAGALFGTAMNALHVSVTLHLVAVGIVFAALVPRAAGQFVATAGASDEEAPARPARAHRAWLERRTLMIGVVVAVFALCEGTGNDWIGVALIGGRHAGAAIATLGFAVFLSAMTTVRWFGPAMIDRVGRVLVLRASLIAGIAGLAIFVSSGSVPISFVGIVLWGCGAGLGFPLGMSAAADDADGAALRVGAVASIGYLGLLGGPPMIGLLAAPLGVTHALGVVPLFLVGAGLVIGAMRPPSDRAG